MVFTIDEHEVRFKPFEINMKIESLDELQELETALRSVNEFYDLHDKLKSFVEFYETGNK